MSVGTDTGINKNYTHPNGHVFEALQKRADITLLCTQVTSQCSNTISSVQNSVSQAIDSQVFARGCAIPHPKTGCPCAGHIVVELGDQAEIVQPAPSFHQTLIVNTFFHQAKCRKTDSNRLNDPFQSTLT